MSLRRHLALPGFTVAQVADGFWVRCSCYEVRYSGVYRTKFHAASAAEALQWMRNHSCEYLSFATAMDARRRVSWDRP